MSKLKKALLISVAVVLWIAAMVSIMIYSGAIVLDHSAEMGSRNRSLVWDGCKYVRHDGVYDTTKRIAQNKDGFDVYAIEEDPGHNFVFVRGNGLYVREDYDIHGSGEITEVFFGYTGNTDRELCDAMEEITLAAEASSNFGAIIRYNDEMLALSLRYDDCPVTFAVGYIGKINDEWVFTADDIYENIYSSGTFTVRCYRIPAKYHPMLEEYFRRISEG